MALVQPLHQEQRRFAVLMTIIFLGMTSAVLAQTEAPFRTPSTLTQRNVVRSALAEFPGSDAITFEGVFAPAGSSGRHRHPGTEVLYVQDGTGVMLRDGRKPVELRPGMTVISEPDLRGGSFVHEVRNTSKTKPLRTYIVLLVDKGEPAALPPE